MFWAPEMQKRWQIFFFIPSFFSRSTFLFSPFFPPPRPPPGVPVTIFYEFLRIALIVLKYINIQCNVIVGVRDWEVVLEAERLVWKLIPGFEVWSERRGEARRGSREKGEKWKRRGERNECTGPQGITNDELSTENVVIVPSIWGTLEERRTNVRRKCNGK